MRRLSVLLLLALTLPAHAQEWGEGFSIQVGTGLGRTLTTVLYEVESEYESKGQDLTIGNFSPTFTVSGVFEIQELTEIVLRAGISRYTRRIDQYGVFGTDPYGRPRYDIKGVPVKSWKKNVVVPSTTVLLRLLWGGGSFFESYSEIGFGISFVDGVKFVPAVTPFAFRAGGEHLYFFVENTYSPDALFLHIGLGWHL